MNALPDHRGYILMEYLVYMGVLAVVLTLGFTTVHRSHRAYLDLKRNADDIERALKAGERWREDVRSASGTPVPIDGGLRIPTSSGEIVYQFAEGNVWREVGDDETPFLKGVKSSRMLLDARQHAHSWRWELELASAQKVVRVRPLFSFQAAKAVAQ